MKVSVMRRQVSRLMPLALLVTPVLASDPLVARLVPADPAHRPSFGETVVLAGEDLLAVGAPDALGHGVVVLFRLESTGWAEEAVIEPVGMASGARFGEAIAFDGSSRLIIGAPHSSFGGLSEQGEVRTYVRDVSGVWNYDFTTTSDLPVAGGHFGAAVSRITWPDHLTIVGEPGNGSGRVTFWWPNSPTLGYWFTAGAPGAEFGAAFAPSTWGVDITLERVLFIGAPGARAVCEIIVHPAHSNYGVSCSLSEPTIPGFGRTLASQRWGHERLAVGHDGPEVELYSTHNYAWLELIHVETLRPFDTAATSRYGSAFRFTERFAWNPAVGMLVVGDPAASMGGGRGSGGAYRVGFEPEFAIQRGPLAPVGAGTGAAAGSSIAATGSTVVLGAPGEGAAYVFDTSGQIGSPWCMSAMNSLDTTPALYGCGSDELVDQRLGLVAVGLPPGVPAMLIASQNAASTPLGAGSAGLRCVDAPFVRFADEVRTVDSGGLVAIRVDPLDLPGGAVIAPGETWTFQCWYRDVVGTTTSNTTHAVRIEFR